MNEQKGIAIQPSSKLMRQAKIYFSTCLFILVNTGDLIAQDNFSFGISAGPSMERRVWLGDSWITFHDRFSLNGGINRNVALGKNLNLETGLSIYDRGSWHEAYLMNSSNVDTPLVRFNSHLWYLSGNLVFKYQAISFTKGKINFLTGVTYGRKVWAYEIQKIYGTSYYSPDRYNRDSPNYYGVILGIGLLKQVRPGFWMEIRPAYIRQLNRGWGKSSVMDNKGRYDSYTINLIVWFAKRQGTEQ